MNSIVPIVISGIGLLALGSVVKMKSNKHRRNKTFLAKTRKSNNRRSNRRKSVGRSFRLGSKTKTSYGKIKTLPPPKFS